MAARNSCTHLTWAEAKGKVAGPGKPKGKAKPKLQSHSQIIANKFIAKNTNGVADKKVEKAYRRQEEKVAALSVKHEEEKELKRLASLQQVQQYEQAKEKLSELVVQLQQQQSSSKSSSMTDSLSNKAIPTDTDELNQILECKETQMDEIMALEAMLPDDFVMSETGSSNLSELQVQVEQLRESELEQETLLRSIVRQDPLSFYLTLEIDDDGNSDNDRVAMILLKVTLPPLYPIQSVAPQYDFEYVMVTDKNDMVSANKPLVSLAWLDQPRLKQALTEQAENDVLPYPCVYELAVTWLSEHLFEYLESSLHS